MTNYNFGDVVLVGFPFTNLEATKKRPAVIICSESYQQNRPDVILMAITSKIREPFATGEVILQNWQKAGLPKPSVLKPLIATLEQTRIIKVLGKLSSADKNGLRQVLQDILGESGK